MIQLNDFKVEPPELKAEMLEAVERVMESGHYILGPEVLKFEKAWALRNRVNHCVGVASGLDAIEVGLRAMGVGPGDEVITTPMTAVATVLGICRVGATPVLADIDPQTGLLSLESAQRCVSPRTRALLLVYLYGQMPSMDAWIRFCSDNAIDLVEDCAQAHEASDQGRFSGSIGKFGAFSFYPTKNLGARGDAGALTSNDPILVSTALKLRNYGQATRYVHDIVGINSRLDEMQAAILNARLSWLNNFTNKRRHIAEIYLSEIANPSITLLARPESRANHVYHQFVVKVKDRENFQYCLSNSGIQTLIHYPIPVHNQKPFLSITRDPKGLKNAEDFAAECISIPCAPHLVDEEIMQIVEVLNNWK